MEDVRERPCRPADGYLAMARILPPSYFLTPIPSTDVVDPEVVGRDQRPTVWRLPAGLVRSTRNLLPRSVAVIVHEPRR